MPRIFDNIDQKLLPALQETLCVSNRADFSVGYFNLRGWKSLAAYVDEWPGGDGHCCRLLVGMQEAPKDELRDALKITGQDEGMDQAAVVRLKKKLAQEFRDQLTVGFQNNADEAGLRRLAVQLRAQKVVVRLYLRCPLHAKLYLMHRTDPINPIIGYLGSSNLTFSGLSGQGELNVDVLDGDAAKKLSAWFEDRWTDRWCVDISEELAQIIEESWARETPIPPYHIYIKMAYHLSQEARAGLSEFRIPKVFGDKLFDYQTAAVKIAARHLHKRGGVMIGDVVGLGKTLMATALARMFEDDFGVETLILCPKNLEKMWLDYRDQYGLRARVLRTSKAIRELPTLRRHRLVLIDESHNLRNREGKTYRAIREYIEKNESQTILLTATPYNKTYLDLSSQLRLFVSEEKDLGVRPEQLLREIGEVGFGRLDIGSPRSLRAFEASEFPDDWRELMRLYLVRRTRSFIMENYASIECAQCGETVAPTEARCSRCDHAKGKTERRFLTLDNGTRSYFPTRVPKTVKVPTDAQYAALAAQDVVNALDGLTLPRYGLGNERYGLDKHVKKGTLTAGEAKIAKDLWTAGNRLKGFTRTNLYKRLESSGQAFMLSVERHVLRNYVLLHAIEHGLPIPIGAQGAEMLDVGLYDEDADDPNVTRNVFDEADEETEEADQTSAAIRAEAAFRQRAQAVYERYAGPYKSRFKWLPSTLFAGTLKKDLRADVEALRGVLDKCSDWEAAKDAKLNALYDLLTKKHPKEKVLVFTQFADTVRYLETELKRRGLTHIAGVTGQSYDPTEMAWRFSPVSNDKRVHVTSQEELRVLIASDVLSEGQNLQDAAVVVSFDLPWAIIRLIQRCGRVDRIGQHAEKILCYSFLPADGVEKVISLRERLRKRLQENAEVVGTDEQFFEDDRKNKVLLDIYNEKAGVLDGDADNEVDLASRAFQIWHNAITQNPSLKKTITELPPVSYSTRSHTATAQQPDGVLVYLRTGEGNDALAWMDASGRSVTESQYTILRAAECEPDTPALARQEDHHDLVRAGVEHIVSEEQNVGGQLGRPSGARFRVYERLSRYAGSVKGSLFESLDLERAIQDIYKYPLTQTAVDCLNSHLRGGVSDEMLAQLAILLRDESRLCIISDEERTQEPRIVCSLGLTRK